MRVLEFQSDERPHAPRSVAGVILAAGGSVRMGRPKQLLQFEGESLLHRTARIAIESGLDPVMVVLGACSELTQDELDGLPVRSVPNADWQRGIGSSIRVGVNAVLANASQIDAIVVMVCDQPFLTSEVIGQLIAAHLVERAPVAASAYAGTRGVPALFARSCFDRLRSLPDDEGARDIIASAGANACFIPFPRGTQDIDTPDDARRVLSSATAR